MHQTFWPDLVGQAPGLRRPLRPPLREYSKRKEHLTEMSLPTYFLRQRRLQPSRDPLIPDYYLHPEDYDPVLRAHCRLEPEPRSPATPSPTEEDS
jgi:hypothetical protein